MNNEKLFTYDRQPLFSSRWMDIGFMLLLLAGAVYFYMNYGCIDGCGPYHNTTSVADLDNDGDLDVVLSSLRHESQTVFWAGPTLWINQGGGEFAPQRVNIGGPSTTTGDVDADGDADIVQMTYVAKFYLNQGGAQGGKTGNFKEWRSISPQEDVHNWSSPGTVVLGDLDKDGQVDVLVSYCCSMLISDRAGDEDFFHFLPFVWMNMQEGRNLTSLGDLPMRPTLGDLDGDGDLDIYAASLPPTRGRYDSADRIFWNDGSGGFTDSGQRLDNPRKSGAAGSGAAALGDLDGDGDLDALVATAKGAAIWINQGGAQDRQMGLLAEAGQRLGRGHIEAVFLADFDADGELDALVGGKAQASIWWNDGQAGFRDSGQRLRYDERHGLAVGDFDGNGSLDVFSAAGDFEFRLWLNQGDGRLEEGE